MTNQENRIPNDRPEDFAPVAGITSETTNNGRRTNHYFRNAKGKAFRITIFNANDVPCFARIYRVAESRDPGKAWDWNSLATVKTQHDLLGWFQKPMFTKNGVQALISQAITVNAPYPGQTSITQAFEAPEPEATGAAKVPTPEQRKEIHQEAVEAFKEMFSSPVAARALSQLKAKPEPKPEPKPYEYMNQEYTKPQFGVKELRNRINSFKADITQLQQSNWRIGDQDHDSHKEQFRFCLLVDELIADLANIRHSVCEGD